MIKIKRKPLKLAITALALIGVACSIIFAFSGKVQEEPKTPEEEKIEMRTDIKVAIDPGHGGIDSGTHDGQGVLEKDITLDIVLKMRECLEKQGIPVIMTRETDDDVSDMDGRGRHRRDLEGRAKIINQGTVGISIHVNSSNQASERGFIVFYAKGSEKGEILAQKAINSLITVQQPNHDFPVPRQNLYLLRNTQVPMILVEVGFMTNPEDKGKLQDPDYRQAIAEALSKIFM